MRDYTTVVTLTADEYARLKSDITYYQRQVAWLTNQAERRAQLADTLYAQYNETQTALLNLMKICPPELLQKNIQTI